MLFMLIDKGYQLDEVVFYDTGMEFQAIYNTRDAVLPILKKLGIEGNYEGIGHCAIGYAAEPVNAPAPRKENYVYYVK